MFNFDFTVFKKFQVNLLLESFYELSILKTGFFVFNILNPQRLIPQQC